MYCYLAIKRVITISRAWPLSKFVTTFSRLFPESPFNAKPQDTFGFGISRMVWILAIEKGFPFGFFSLKPRAGFQKNLVFASFDPLPVTQFGFKALYLKPRACASIRVICSIKFIASLDFDFSCVYFHFVCIFTCFSGYFP